MRFIGPAHATLILGVLLVATGHPIEGFLVAVAALTMPRI